MGGLAPRLTVTQVCCSATKPLCGGEDSSAAVVCAPTHALWLLACHLLPLQLVVLKNFELKDYAQHGLKLFAGTHLQLDGVTSQRCGQCFGVPVVYQPAVQGSNSQISHRTLWNVCQNLANGMDYVLPSPHPSLF